MLLRSKCHNIAQLQRRLTTSGKHFLDYNSTFSVMDEHTSNEEKRLYNERSFGIENESYVPDLPPKESKMSASSRQPLDTGQENQSTVSDDTESYISDNLEETLPSRAYREIRGLPSNNILKQNMRKTLRERKPKPQEGFSVDNDQIVENEGQVYREMQDLTPDEYADFMGRQRDIRDMPTSIRRKRTIKNNMDDNAKMNVKTKHISAWKHFKLTFAMGWQHFKDTCSELLYVLDLWRGHLKAIQGIFGSGVLSYFILLRWLFLINLVAFTSSIFFLFIPQMVFDASFKKNNASFQGWELLTGDGYFTSTELYYGIYTNKPIPMGGDLIYKMPLAYLCVGGGYLLLCLAIMVFSMAESYRENYIYTGDDFSFYVSKVFCAWDYGITDEESAVLKQKSISNDLKEVIAEQLFNQKRSGKELCCLVLLRSFTNLIVIALIGGGCFLIFYTAQESSEIMKDCWESFVGMTFYRLILVDFFFLLLSTFFGEFVRSLFAKHVGWCGQNIGFPGFDISRNVLDLVYAQMLAWIGTFFSPLLSVVNVIKLFLLFHVKRVSVVQNCKASGRPFRAAKMNLLFLMLLGVSFMVSIITVGYTVMSDDEHLGQERMYQVISNEIADFPYALRTAIQYISSASFLTMIFCILGIIVYYYKMLKDSNEKKILLLKDQIALAGQDKLFLMGKITAAASSGFQSASDIQQ